MKNISRPRLSIVIAAALFAPLMVHAGSKSNRSLNEEAALNLLLRTVERDHVYDKRISLDCVSFGTEETAKEYFQFVLRENHTVKCGGDPDVSPVVDRYRVYRVSGKIECYGATNDSWKPYRAAH